MTKGALAFLLLFAIFYPSLARADSISSLQADTSDPPDVSDWKVEATYLVDVRLSDLVVIYLGLETLYSNPDGSGEFALITKRHRPLIMAKFDPRDDRMFKSAIVNFYNRKELEDILQKRHEEADTIVSQKWREIRDVRTGQPVRTGDIEVWFLDSAGNANVVLNQKVSTGSVSELRSPDFKDGILAGVKYSIGDSYQIIRAEHTFLIMALKKEEKS